MKRYLVLPLWLSAVTMVMYAQAQQQKQAAGPLIDDKHLLMQIEEVPISGVTNIYGDPAKPGFYMVRVHLAPNTRTRPRYDDQSRWVTVLKGTWWVGEGDVFRTEKLVPVREGGVMYFPVNMRHFDVADSGDVILQIVGTGPVKTVHSEVDANGQPVPIGGPYPENAATEGAGRRGRGGRRGMPPT